jgi:hypothetical protein
MPIPLAVPGYSCSCDPGDAAAAPPHDARAMTKKTDFDQEEWDLIAEGPATAGMIVIRAEGGGTFRETIALAHAYGDARKQHGQSELLDEIVSSKPEFDRHRYRTDADLKGEGMARIGQAVSVLREKATPQEVSDYGSFVLTLARAVAEAHTEHGQKISPAEQAALDGIRERIGNSA